MVTLGSRNQYHEKKGKKVYTIEDCPFCTKIDEQEGHILWKGKHWFILHNLYPYSGNNQHLMAVPYAHKKIFLELSDEELLELRDVNIFLKDFYGDDSYFSCLRETMANRSVEHLHYHYIPGKLQGKYLRKMLMEQGFPIVEKQL